MHKHAKDQKMRAKNKSPQKNDDFFQRMEKDIRQRVITHEQL